MQSKCSNGRRSSTNSRRSMTCRQGRKTGIRAGTAWNSHTASATRSQTNYRRSALQQLQKQSYHNVAQFSTESVQPPRRTHELQERQCQCTLPSDACLRLGDTLHYPHAENSPLPAIPLAWLSRSYLAPCAERGQERSSVELNPPQFFSSRRRRAGDTTDGMQHMHCADGKG